MSITAFRPSIWKVTIIIGLFLLSFKLWQADKWSRVCVEPTCVSGPLGTLRCGGGGGCTPPMYSTLFGSFEKRFIPQIILIGSAYVLISLLQALNRLRRKILLIGLAPLMLVASAAVLILWWPWTILQPGCAVGIGASCYEMRHYAKDDHARREYLGRACKAGYGDGCQKLAQLTSGKEQEEWYEKGCRVQHIGSCVALAELYRGKGEVKGVEGFYASGCWSSSTNPFAYPQRGEACKGMLEMAAARGEQEVVRQAAELGCTERAAFATCGELGRLNIAKGGWYELDAPALLQHACNEERIDGCLALAEANRDDAEYCKEHQTEPCAAVALLRHKHARARVTAAWTGCVRYDMAACYKLGEYSEAMGWHNYALAGYLTACCRYGPRQQRMEKACERLAALGQGEQDEKVAAGLRECVEGTGAGGPEAIEEAERIVFSRYEQGVLE